MKLREFLLEQTEVGDIVIFQKGGWQIGMTRIDSEDLFIRSIDLALLRREVRHYEYSECDWATQKVLVVDIR